MANLAIVVPEDNAIPISAMVDFADPWVWVILEIIVIVEIFAIVGPQM